jgi:predicted amidophosphoribosyltransferase
MVSNMCLMCQSRRAIDDVICGSCKNKLRKARAREDKKRQQNNFFAT